MEIGEAGVDHPARVVDELRHGIAVDIVSPHRGNG